MQRRSINLRELLLEAQEGQAEAEANEQETADENERLHADIRRFFL